MDYSQIKTDCVYFKGDRPCGPHKNCGIHCVEGETSCQYYKPVKERILLVKLGFIGDVIRTTPLLTKLKAEYPQAKFFWLTSTPSVIPAQVDVILDFNLQSILFLKGIQFDLAINLDKDREACALINHINCLERRGYILQDGISAPADEKAVAKYMTGLFDDLNKQNDKNYLEEIFQICGYKFGGEKYILSSFNEYKDCWKRLDKTKKIVGLNTGCGERWTSRLWKDENWISIAKKLINMNYEVLFLGGEQEDEKNKRLAEESDAKYFGCFKLEKFINLVDQCDLVVTGVTMAMHVAIALNKKIVLFNNIFNPKEFELYGLGEIVAPSKECQCFLSPKCQNEEYNCMDYIEPERVFHTIMKLLRQ